MLCLHDIPRINTPYVLTPILGGLLVCISPPIIHCMVPKIDVSVPNPVIHIHVRECHIASSYPTALCHLYTYHLIITIS